MKDKLEQMLEHLVNDEQDKAEELFHEYVVAKSREIYETLIEEEMKDDEDEDEDVEEAAEKDEDDEDEKVDEEFEDIAIEGDDEDDMGGPDMTDDAMDDMGMDDEGGDDLGDKDPEELLQDLDAIVDELEAKFAEMNGGEDDDMDDMGDDEMKDGFDPELETVREYVEKVPAGHGAEKKGSAETADNKKSLIDNMKNDMGGTTANILSSKEDAATFANQGELKGSGLLKGKPQEENAGNINVPGGNAGKSGFKTKEPGHGAEKKGAAEQADKSAGSLFRGRR